MRMEVRDRVVALIPVHVNCNPVKLANPGHIGKPRQLRHLLERLRLPPDYIAASRSRPDTWKLFQVVGGGAILLVLQTFRRWRRLEQS
jgi:hypothetical protein